MTPYIIALGALALLLAWSEKGRDRGNGYQPNGPKSHKPPPPPTTGSNAQRPSEIVGTVVNVEEDEKGVKFTILLAGDQTIETDKERLNRMIKDLAKISTPKKHGFSCATQPKKKTPKEGGRTMNAKKCDRCGKLYERAYVPDITINEYIHGYGDKRYDICDDCQQHLEKWLNSNFQINRKKEKQ